MTGPHYVDVFRDPDAEVFPWMWACMRCSDSADFESESEAVAGAENHEWGVR